MDLTSLKPLEDLVVALQKAIASTENRSKRSKGLKGVLKTFFENTWDRNLDRTFPIPKDNDIIVKCLGVVSHLQTQLIALREENEAWLQSETPLNWQEISNKLNIVIIVLAKIIRALISKLI